MVYDTIVSRRAVLVETGAIAPGPAARPLALALVGAVEGAAIALAGLTRLRRLVHQPPVSRRWPG